MRPIFFFNLLLERAKGSISISERVDKDVLLVDAVSKGDFLPSQGMPSPCLRCHAKKPAAINAASAARMPTTRPPDPPLPPLFPSTSPSSLPPYAAQELFT